MRMSFIALFLFCIGAAWSEEQAIKGITKVDPALVQGPIASALDEKITVDFTAEPFTRAIKRIGALSGMNIVVASELIKDPPGPVTMKCENMKTRAVLEAVLKLNSLHYEALNGALFIQK
jgi:hypothetical protein